MNQLLLLLLAIKNNEEDNEDLYPCPSVCQWPGHQNYVPSHCSCTWFPLPSWSCYGDGAQGQLQAPGEGEVVVVVVELEHTHILAVQRKRQNVYEELQHLSWLHLVYLWKISLTVTNSHTNLLWLAHIKLYKNVKTKPREQFLKCKCVHTPGAL